jgi:uncharacterized protein YggE
MLKRLRWQLPLSGALVLLTAAGCTTTGMLTAVPQAAAPGARSEARLQTDEAVQPRTVSVDATGEATASPDVVTVELGVEIENADLSQALADANQRMSDVSVALEDAGIVEENIQTSRFNISVIRPRDEPVREMVLPEAQAPGEEQPEMVTRYRVTNYVQVRVPMDDVEQVGEVLQQALDAGANTVNYIRFGLQDPSVLEEQARDAAINAAQTKAEQLANGFGATLGPIRSVNSGGGAPARAVAMEAAAPAAMGAVPISAGELSVNIHVQATFDLIVEE